LRKDFVGSLAAYEAAYPILRAALGADHVQVGMVLSNIGETLLALGRRDAAEDNFVRARAIVERALGARHLLLAFPLKGIGLAELARGRPGEAIAPLERALALRTQAGPTMIRRSSPRSAGGSPARAPRSVAIGRGRARSPRPRSPAIAASVTIGRARPRDHALARRARCAVTACAGAHVIVLAGRMMIAA
jgi:tetratricopeptide (TPR) repeat protein